MAMTKGPREIGEEWFLERLEAADREVDVLIETFDALASDGKAEEADEWSGMLFRRLAEEGRPDEALTVLEWMAGRGTPEDPATATKTLFSGDRNATKMVEAVGFGSGTPAVESIRRLRRLRGLKNGTLCYNATWGFGVVQDVDYFYKNLEIEFDRKGEHEMSFSYAAEALEALDDEHVLAVKHKRPEEMAALLKDRPGEVVRMALRSYGPMPVERLRAALSPSIVPEKSWKRFWDQARRELKEDATVEIPRKRSENVTLLAKARSYDDAWFSELRKERDIEVLFERFGKILEKGIDHDSETARAALANRLAFIVNGAPSGRPEWKAEGFVFARLLGVEPEGVDSSATLRGLIGEKMIEMLERLPPRHLSPLFSVLLGNDRESVIAALSEIVPKVGSSVLNEVAAALIDAGAEEAFRCIMASALAKRTASAPMLLWCQRSAGLMEKWNLITNAELAFRIQEVLEEPASGATLRAQNRLRERFRQESWLNEALGGMTPQQRRDFLRRIHDGRGWELLDRKSVIAKVLRTYPELQDIVVGNRDASASKRPRAQLTSERSYVERQRELERVVKIEIPENSKEIELARSYGDLRENAEFKYAKERQGLLMARQTQLVDELEQVKPTDFSGIPTDEVAMGTGVKLRYPDGSTEIFYVLGVWDQDDALGIVSSETRLAQSLMGGEAGDRVTIPSGECEIVEVLPLSEEVGEWILPRP